MTPRTKAPSFAGNTKFESQQKLGNDHVARISSTRRAAFAPSTSPMFVHFVTGFVLYAIRFTFPGYWQDCYNFIERQWNQLIDNSGVDEFNFMIWGTVLYTMGLFWAGGILYLAMDLTGRPKALRKYKVQPGANEPPEFGKLRKLMGQVLFNQTVVTIPLTYIGAILQQSRHPPVREIPSLGKVFIDFVVCMIIFEALFYYSHRMLHHPKIFRHIHKMHHEWTSPVALGAIYCHPVEHVFSNILPQIVGLSLMRSHVFTTWVWFTYVLIITLAGHSGYHLPLMPAPEYHDFHHLTPNQNFGGGDKFFDWLHGTDVKYRASIYFDRAHPIIGLASPRELYPDEKQD